MDLKILTQAEIDHYDIEKHQENQESVKALKKLFQESKVGFPQ